MAFLYVKLITHYHPVLKLKSPWRFPPLPLYPVTVWRLDKGAMFTLQVLNPGGATCNNGSTEICIPELRSYFPVEPDMLKPIPDVHLELGFGFHSFSFAELFRSNTYHRFLRKYHVADSKLFCSTNRDNIYVCTKYIQRKFNTKIENVCPMSVHMFKL